MHRRPSKKREIILRVITYIAMIISVLVIVGILIFLILGYRLDTDSGKIEQGALVQFETIPSGATVTIDSKTLGPKTSTKSTVVAGVHSFTMSRSGYETWQKTVDIKAGTLTWLDYARLVPKDRKAQSVATFPTVYNSMATQDGKAILIQQTAATPSFQIIDLRSDDIKTTTVTIPANLYSESANPGVVHSFAVNQWDTGGRYVLLQHTFGDKKEWLVMDSKDGSVTKNITSLLDLDISQIVFSGTSGNILYALAAGDIRKLDLSAGTISRSLVTGVSQFELFETNVITYVGTDTVDPKKTVVGLYREGDTTAHVIRSIPTTDSSVHITTARYFNQDYVAISQGNAIDILSGSYPTTSGDDISSLAKFASFTVAKNVDLLSFSPKGDYLLVQTGSDFASYDIEHQRIINYSISTDPAVNVGPIKWLDDDHTWSDFDGNLVMREFDGANAAIINQSVPGQGVALTQNDKYIYSIGSTAAGFQLQRVRMTLP